jgi:hypothetical protein
MSSSVHQKGGKEIRTQLTEADPRHAIASFQEKHGLEPRNGPLRFFFRFFWFFFVLFFFVLAL